MHIRLSIPLLVTVTDSLQVMDHHLYATRQLPPLFLCCPSSGRAKEYGKSILGGSLCTWPEILVPSYLLWGNIFVNWLPRSMFVLATHLCFPWVSRASNSFPFFIQKPFHIPLLLLRYTPSLEPKTKREFLHLLSSKTLFSPLMVDFDFIRKETPSVSFFFARLGVFLKSSSGSRPHVGLFVPRDCGAFKIGRASCRERVCNGV